MATRYQKSRLGELLIEMKVVEAAVVEAAVAEKAQTGRQLASILAAKGVIDEERLTRVVAARLGLEAVSLASLRIHGRVLAQVDAAVAKARCVLPIAIKRTAQAELLYLVMCDPLDQQAIAEVQERCGKQVRVLMAAATELVQVIEHHYAVPNTSVAPEASSPVRSSPAVDASSPSPPSAYDPNNPPTLTDSERPPELDALFDRLRRQEGRPAAGVSAQPLPQPTAHTKDEPFAPVAPSELDEREDQATFIDVPLDSSSASTGEWDRSAQSLKPSTPDSATLPAPSALPPMPAPPAASPWNDLSQPGGMPQAEGEDIATSTFELSQVAAVQVRGPKVSSTPPAFVDALEVPVEPDATEHPFHGPDASAIPVGLEKTGIFPAVDLGGDSFDPPPLTESQSAALAGHTDIPESDAAVRARFADAEERSDSDDIQEIEEIPPGAEQTPPYDIPILEPSHLSSVPDAEALSIDESTRSEGSPPAGLAPPTPARGSQPALNIPAPARGSDLKVPAPGSQPVAKAPGPARGSQPAAKAPAPARGSQPAAKAPAPARGSQPALKAPAPASGSQPRASVAPPKPEPVALKPFRSEPPTPEPTPPQAELPKPGQAELTTSASAPESAAAARDPITDEGPAATENIAPPKIHPREDSSEEPTPAKDPLDRSDVLAALENNFMPQTMKSDVDDKPASSSAVDERRVRAEAIVRRLRAGESLTSAERAELVLAATRLLLDRGVFSSEDLVATLLSDS